jgi:hypothetical protein
MLRLIDLTGQRFGNLTVISRAPKEGQAYWVCRCDCGTVREFRSRRLRSGYTKSCGCKQGEGRRTHGATRGGNTPEYRAFHAAKTRCTNPNQKRWMDWGGRGIKFLFVDFEEFFLTIGPRPSPQHTVDRINNDGNYEPGNVRWATKEEQNANQRPRKGKAQCGTTPPLPF